MTTAVLEVSRLCKRFGVLAVTNDVSLRLAAGARHALIGPNGAGKTTLVGLISGVIAPDSGRITLMGRDVTKDRPARRVKQGLVRTFQVSSLFRGLTVLENLYLAASEHLNEGRQLLRPAAKSKEVLRRAERVLLNLGLADNCHRRVSEISYGEQRLIEIAIALCIEPKVLLLDEPTAGVPSSEVALVLEVIERLPSEMAILMIEHDMQVVKRFAQTVTVLVGGEVLLTETPQAVMHSPDVRRLYLGQKT